MLLCKNGDAHYRKENIDSGGRFSVSCSSLSLRDVVSTSGTNTPVQHQWCSVERCSDPSNISDNRWKLSL